MQLKVIGWRLEGNNNYPMKHSSFVKNLSLLLFGLVISTISFSQEDCSNGIDDDGDGLIDCLDPDCIGDVACPAFDVPGACLPIGYYPDITGTNGGYKAAGSTAIVNMPIAPNTNRVSLIIQGVYQQAANDGQTGINDLNHAQERVIWGRVEIDLDNGNSSGWVEYLVNNHESKRFSWVDQDLGPNMTDTYVRVGHDFNELVDYEFSFDANATDLMIGCSRAELDISYYAIYYGNFASESMTRIEGADPSQYPTYFDAGNGAANITQTIDLMPGPDFPDYIQLRAIGINQNRTGHSGVLVQDTREECISIKYILINTNTMTASGAITVGNGNIESMNSTFTFDNYDVTSGQPITVNATTLGDLTANITPPDQISLADMTIEIVGNQLVISRSDVYAEDYNEIYYIEFLKYSGQPYSSSFFITDNAYSGPQDIGYDPGANNNGVGVDGYVDFTIPQGAKRAYLEIRANGLWAPSNLSYYEGQAPSNTTRTNGNQMYAFTEVNFDLEETTGYYATVTTSSQQQLYAWQAVPIDPAVDITTTGIYGQLPNNDERINFEIIQPDIFRVHLRNDNIAYERTLQITFLGSKVNLVYSSFDQNTSIFTGCDSVYFDMEICNSGGADLTQQVPVSFYYGDPTVDPTSVYLQTEMYDLNIEQGQCETFTFGIDIASLGGVSTGDITVVLNDNGSYGGTAGSQIPATFTPLDLFDQGNPVLECEFDQNIITASYNLTPPPAPTISFNQNTFTICPGDAVTIIGTPSGTVGEFTYDWSPQAGSTDQITVSPNSLTWYYLTVEDVCNSVIDSVKVEMGEVDLTNISIVNAQSCPGLGGFIPGEVHVTPDDPTYTYTLTGPSIYGPQNDGDFTAVDPGTYFLNVLNADGCTIDTAITVGTDANIPTPTFVLDSLRDVSCFGANDGGAYVMNIESTPTPVPPYDVTWTSPIGVHFQESVSGQAAGNGDSEVDDLFGGQWIVTVTDNDGCPWSTVFTINEPDELILDWISNNPTCYQFSDGSVTVNSSGGNGGNTILIWDDTQTTLNPGGTNTANQLNEGWYYASVEDVKGCFVLDSILLEDPGELLIDLQLTQPLCYGDFVGLAVVDTVYNYTGDYNQVAYFWQPNNGGQQGIGADSLENLGAGSYNLIINDQNGCDNSFDFNIIWPDSMYFSELGFHAAYCRLFEYQSGNGVVYAAASGGAGNFTYQWFDLYEEQTSTNSTWGGLNPGEFQITAIDDNGCTLTELIVLDSLSPIADFEMTSPQFVTNYEGTAPVNVTFINQSLYFANPNNPNADTTFFWNFDYDNIPWVVSHDVNEVFDTTYAIGGEYQVCLVALNKNGCSDTLCKPLIIYDPLIFKPVNVFTPNGDGDNDKFTFEFVSQAVAEFECVIVDRWGVVMYEMTSITDSWDGTDKSGSECSDGTYFYVYKGTADNGEEFDGQGNITLIRGE